VEVACYGADVVDSIGVRGIMRRLLLWKRRDEALYVIDGRAVLYSPLKWVSVVKADSLSFSVSAASIIAKTVRDSLMRFYAPHFPHHFGGHKGYLTRKHLKEIESFGFSEVHRRTFVRPKLFGGDRGES